MPPLDVDNNVRQLHVTSCTSKMYSTSKTARHSKNKKNARKRNHSVEVAFCISPPEQKIFNHNFRFIIFNCENFFTSNKINVCTFFVVQSTVSKLPAPLAPFREIENFTREMLCYIGKVKSKNLEWKSFHLVLCLVCICVEHLFNTRAHKYKIRKICTAETLLCYTFCKK